MMDEECIHGMGDPAWCVICNGRAARDRAAAQEAASTVEYSFKAKFVGRCAECLEPWRPGELVSRCTDERIRHAGCVGQ